MDPIKFLDKCYDSVPISRSGQHEEPNFEFKQLFNGKPFKTKVCVMELYPECSEHMDAIKKIIQKGIDLGHKYAMIVHDKDLIPKEPDSEVSEELLEKLREASYDGIHKKIHVHIVEKHRSQRYNTGIAKEYGISSNHVHMYHDKELAGRLAYLLHIDYIDKYHYPISEVCGTFSDQLENYINSYMIEPVEMFKSCVEYLNGIPPDRYISRTDLQNYIIRYGYLSIIKGSYYRLLCDRIYDHNEIYKMIKASNEKGETLL